MLLSENPEIDLDLVGCFKYQVDYVWPEGYVPNLDAFFEHGHWWVHDVESSACWSVVDCEGPDCPDGVDFEQVTDGDFDAFYNEQARAQEG